MESIGDMLKNRRSERGLTLAEAYESTKITMQNLAALEEDRFDAFPNRVYARAFLRDYANYLGLNSNEMLQRYETDWCESTAPQVSTRRPLRWVAGFGIAVIVLGGVGAGGYYLYTNQKTNNSSIGVEPEKPVAPNPKPEPKPEPKPVPTPGPTPQLGPTAPTGTTPAPVTQPTTGTPPVTKPTTPTTPPAPEKPVTPPKEVVPAGMVKVTLTALERPVWIMVWVDNDKPVSYTLDPKKDLKQATFVGKRIKVSAGDANALDVKINGQPKGRFWPTRKFGVKKTFTPPPANQ